MKPYALVDKEGKFRMQPYSMGGPALPYEDGEYEEDDFFVEQALHALSHAEDFAEARDYEAAQAWAAIGGAWAAMDHS